MTKGNIVYNHIKKINKSRKVEGKGDCAACIFNMPTDELASVVGIEKKHITDPCPLTAYVLFIYGFIDGYIYHTVTNDIINTRKKISAQCFNSLSKDEKIFIIKGVQSHCSSCYIGTKEKCYNKKVNKI